MVKIEGKDWILNFRRKLIALYLLKTTLLSLAVGVSLMLTGSIMLSVIAFMLVFGGLMIFKPTWKITPIALANYLNATFTELEESAVLLLKRTEELSLLEKFQVAKINPVFPLANSLKGALKGLWINLFLLIVALVVYFYIPVNKFISEPLVTIGNQNVSKEQVLPEIKRFSVKISPPAYTRKPSSIQRQFTIKAEAGASVTWDIETNVAVKQLRLVFNDKEIVELDNTGKFTKVIQQSGFYQVVLDGKKSDLYSIEVIPDLPVSIKIIAPKPHTTIDVGQTPKVNLTVALSDDYGIQDAYISATLSSGKGEGVSFTEKKLTFSTDFKGKKSVKLQKMLDLIALGMKPGDELYFFIMAKDNHGKESRSDVYLITIVDTSELMSMAGMANGVDLVPEYFRSQRQIIIDTEKLLKEQGTITADEFKNRSNALGMDQKLLRLRYGKFLGEESETEIGGDHDHEEGEGHTEAAFGDVQALMDEYAHKHDIAEDATFFEPELKQQLKAVLNEMWSSELRLRTYKPQEALPFEYKALRLLKDLQQKSRAYVAKTTIKTTKLKLEKRLSGELDKIVQPSKTVSFEDKDDNLTNLKVLLSILEKRKLGKPFSYGDRELLRQGEQQLIMAASNQPASYLSALKALRKVSTANKIVMADIDQVQKAIQKLVGIEIVKPQATTATPDVDLYRSYFNHLKNGI
jgi:hypothetical protein